jgi:arginine decarboxylase
MTTKLSIRLKLACDEAEVDVHIFTNSVSFTVGESGGAIYQILYRATK